MCIGNLSFIDNESKEWSPNRTGDYADDCRKGREYARETIDMIRSEDSPIILGRVAGLIVAGGVYEAVEIGFFQAIAEHVAAA